MLTPVIFSELPRFLAVWGPLILFLLVLAGGETPLVMAGFLAAAGIMDPALASAAALTAALISDSVLFSLGKSLSATRLTKRLLSDPLLSPPRCPRIRARWRFFVYRFLPEPKRRFPLLESGFTKSLPAFLAAIIPGVLLWTAVMLAAGWAAESVLEVSIGGRGAVWRRLPGLLLLLLVAFPTLRLIIWHEAGKLLGNRLKISQE